VATLAPAATTYNHAQAYNQQTVVRHDTPRPAYDMHDGKM